MEAGWKQGEGGEGRGPSLFVPALARKSIKRRNRVSIVRARDTRVHTCTYVWVHVAECTRTTHTRRRREYTLGQVETGRKARLAQAAGLTSS